MKAEETQFATCKLDISKADDVVQYECKGLRNSQWCKSQWEGQRSEMRCASSVREEKR